jgi:hypothetical protein
MNVQELMKDPETVKQAQEQYRAMLSRSATDLEFRKKLLADPRSAVAEFTGKPVPEDFDVVFIENKAAATVVLPDVVDPSAELSENELETVAGGVVWIPIAAAVLCAFVMGATSPD